MAADTRPIPLDRAANRAFVDTTPGEDGRGGWTDQGPNNSLTGFPTGTVSFEGIDFAIPEGGDQALLFAGDQRPDLPRQHVVTAPTGATGDHLYILATAAWGGSDYALAAKIRVEYVSGRSETIQLVYSEHLSGWWKPKAATRARIAWTGRNGGGQSIGAYLSAHPLRLGDEETIQQLVFESPEDAQPVLAVLGLAVGDVPAAEVIPPAPSWEDWEGNDMADWFELPLEYDKLQQPAYWERAFGAFERPAGSLGWTVAQGEDLYFERDTENEIRFHGIAATGSFFTPSNYMAERHAKAIRKYGFNQVRFHSIFDVLLKERDGYKIPEFHPDKLARFDNIFAALKKAGIYVKPSMLFSTLWHPDLVPQGDKLRKLNNTQYYYNAEHQELYLQTIRKFLNHRNPHTGLRYADDPALNMFKIVNESSLFFNTTDSVPGHYRLELQSNYNHWLRERYGSPLTLLEAWAVKGANRPLNSEESLSRGTVALLPITELASVQARHRNRSADQTQFYYELEQAWGGRVVDAIRATGSRTLVQLSSWGGPGHLQEIQSLSNASDLFDFHGKHGYWLHPHGGWSPPEVNFGNRSIFKQPEKNLLYSFYQHAQDTPFAVTEWNFTYPNDYVNEAGPLMAAYGALQNISATHRFNLTSPEKPNRMGAIFNVFHQIGGLMVEPMAYFMFVRGDVRPAPVVFRNAMDTEELHDPMRKRDDGEFQESKNRFYMNFAGQGVPNRTLYVGGVRLSDDPDQHPDIWKPEQVLPRIDRETGITRSITGELLWDENRGHARVMTPKTKALMGAFDNGTYREEGLTMRLNDAYGVVGFSSLDDRPLRESENILLSLVGRQRNSGQFYRYFNTHGAEGYDPEEAFSLESVGHAPILMEPAAVQFELETTRTDGRWVLGPLDLNGYARPGDAVELKVEDGMLHGTVSNKAFQTTNFVLRYQTQ